MSELDSADEDLFQPVGTAQVLECRVCGLTPEGHDEDELEDCHKRLAELKRWARARLLDKHGRVLRRASARKRVAAAQRGEVAKWGDGRLATPTEVEMVHFLRDVEGLSFRQIEARLGISKSQAHRIYQDDVRQDDFLESGVEA